MTGPGPSRTELAEPSEPELVVLDCRGLRCPRPVVELARRMADLPVGALLRVLADDPVASIDIQAWCHMRGQEYLGSLPAPDDTAGDQVQTDVVMAFDVRKTT